MRAGFRHRRRNASGASFGPVNRRAGTTDTGGGAANTLHSKSSPTGRRQDRKLSVEAARLPGKSADRPDSIE